METPKDKIKMIMDRLGMSGTIAAKAMKMPDSTFRKKIMPSLPNSTFTNKNHSDLVNYLIDEIRFLVTYKESHESALKDYEISIDQIRDIYKNYSKYRKQEDWNLFDELIKVVDFMEKPSVFSDIELYTKTIDHIASESDKLKNETNIFTVEKYDDYVHSDKKNVHTRWSDYMIRRRQKTIRDILSD